MSTDRYNFATELIVQAVCFYIGVALFIGICMVPPFIVMLPYALPMAFMICIIVNISFVIRFVKGTSREIEEVKQEFIEHTGIDVAALDDVLTQLEDTAISGVSTVDVEDIANKVNETTTLNSNENTE